MPPKNPGRDTAQPPISSFFKKASQPSNQSSSTSLSSGLNSSYKDEIDIIESARPKKKRRTEISPGEIIDLETHSDEDISQTSTRTKVQPTASNSTSSLTLADNVKQRAEAIDIASNPARSQSQRCTAPGITVDANAKPIPRADVSRPSSSSRINIFRASKSSGNEQLASAEQKKRHELWQSKLSQGMIIPRRNSLPLDQAAGMENDQDVGLDEMEDRDEEVHGNAKERKAETVKTVKGKKKEEVGPSGMAYTPLEKQFMQIKGENPDVLLLTEVGYKFKFLGDDAKIASKELGIACFPSRNFYSASIPVHRLPIHVKKLIARGYKVGVVRQTETAALKAVGDNRNKPFERRLTSLYTAATYVDDSSLEEDDLLTDPSRLTNTFLCLTETCAGVQSQDVRISLVGVTIGTGDVVYDDFTDTLLRNELETRLAHLSPTEILLPDDKLSKATEKTVGSWTKKAENTTTTGTRLERFAFPISREKAMKAIGKYHQLRQQQRQVDASNDPIDISSDGETEQPELLSVTQLKRLPSGIVLCIAAAMKHLERFGLEDALLHLEAFRKLATQTSMLLSANTLANLEIYRNQTDQGLKGSLLWLMDQTRTKMGKRLLRDWIGRPLVDRRLLEERLDAVTELKDSSSLTLDKLRSLLRGAIPDLSRGLSRIQYGRATPSEVATILLAFQRLASEFEPELPTGTPSSSLLTRIAKSFPRIKAIIDMLLNQIDIRKARSDRPEDMFRDTSRFPAIGSARSSIAEAEIALDKHLKDIRKETKMGTLQYITVAGIEHLIELKLKVAVPDNWVKVSATKTAARYHTPFVVSRAKELERGKESLMMAGKRAFLEWQEEISRHCEALREATLSIATFDCLSSLAKVAIGSGTDYCRPNFVEGSTLDLEGARHPMSELLIDSYVANDVKFSESTSRLMILTGPNMAGKTSFTRAVALCLVMAQVGSYTPCAKAVLSIHDAIWTRMGASDDLARNRSTFMVELKETSDILSGATSKSFVVLDELGRGTSTADGTAIAWAVLDYLARKRCNTIFTTHFPSLARIKDQYNKQVSVQHMGFTELRRDDGYPEIVFLYKLFPSLSLRSFGTYVGRLAGLDVKILRAAEEKSEWMRLHKGRESSERIGYRVGEQWSRLGGPSQDIWKAIQDLLEQAKKVPCRR